MNLDSQLRETLARRAADVVPEPDPYERLLRRRGRRTARRVLGGAAGIVVAALAVPLALGGLSGDRPAPDTPQPVEGVLWPVQVGFVDASHGFVTYTWRQRPPGPASKDCPPLRVRLTDDGGRTWGDAIDPDPPCDNRSTVVRYHVTMLDRDSILITGYGYSTISHDAGATWSTRQTRAFDVSQLPFGSTAELSCGGLPECAAEEKLGAYEPGGNLMQLRGLPLGGPHDLHQDTDGTLWVSGVDDAGEFAVAVSRDRGRTWTTASTGVRAGNPEETRAVLVARGQTGYVKIADIGSEADRADLLFRTGDGGGHWSRVTAAGLPRQGRPGDVMLLADGTLVDFESDPDWYASTDSGATFHPVADTPGGDSPDGDTPGGEREEAGDESTADLAIWNGSAPVGPSPDGWYTLRTIHVTVHNGVDRAQGQPASAYVFRSPDGRDWRRVDLPIR